MRTPKDIKKYIPSVVAGVRLIDLAVKQILCRRDAKVKWELKLHIYHSKEALEKSSAIAVPLSGTFSSGDFEEAATEP